MISVALEDLLLRVLGLPPSPLPRGDSTFRCSCSVHEGPSTLVCVSPQTSPNPTGKVRKARFTYLEESLRRPCQAQKLPPTLMGSPGWKPHQPHYSQRNGPVVKLIGKKMWQPTNQSQQHHLSSSSLSLLLISSWFWCLCHSFALCKRRLF